MTGCGAERGLISVDEAIELISNRPKKLGSIQQPLQNSLSGYLAKKFIQKLTYQTFLKVLWMAMHFVVMPKI